MNTWAGRGLYFKHIGVFNRSGNIIVSALDKNTDETILFLIIGDEEKAYCSRDLNQGWELLDHGNMALMLQSVCYEVAHGAAVLQIDEK
jgi:hypothetical protein